jgi:death-on-curing protein
MALVFHDEQLAEHGGGAGVRDIGGLESALARAQNLLAYSTEPPTIGDLAAAYAFGITRNHPFVDGNKRTALVVSEAFLDLNGYELTASNEETYLTFVALAEGSLSQQEFRKWMNRFIVPKRKSPIAAKKRHP